ncbi:RPA-related protein RADX [Melopsittacus undulatus]|uniref:Uncharacterized protein n=1 Tax=Melopsittacus undulatus TaxID=13146 RepID=A0A8C6K143_MELUD|nr:RPA-related protein RADX [Melopsittacus undulatus]
MQDPTSDSNGEGWEEAAAMPQSASETFLRSIFEEVQRDPQLTVVPVDPPPVTVVAVERYLAPAQPGGPRYYYDVVLEGGECRLFCYLAPHLNGLVQRAHLRPGVRLRVKRCTYRYEEKRLYYGYPCLEELELELGCGTEPTLGDEGRGGLMPLCGGEEYYLPLWNNDDPYGNIWVAEKPETMVHVDVCRLISLGQLEMNWKTSMRHRPVLVRILHKSRLRYYGKPEKRNTDIPYQAYFEVADDSGMMSMVLWNSLCPEWYKSMKVGTVLLLEQYGVKNSYPFKTQPTPGDSQMKIFSSIEICLNIRDPPTKINIIPEEMVKPEWGLPEVKYRFITRSELDGLPNNHSCDIIGLVTFVGRAERARKKEQNEDFWLYRWAHAIDGTSDQPFILELFATSQPEMFERICPMTFLVCTQMRVVRDLSENPSSTVYLTTSNESQIFVTGGHSNQPYTRDTKVRSFLHWTRTQNEVDQMEKTVIGGYYPFPRPPNSFLKYCKHNKVESVLKAIDETGKEIQDLQYREHKSIAVQGILSAIRYISYSSMAEKASEVELPQKDDSQSPESSASSQEDSIHKERGTNLQNREVLSYLGSQYTPGEKHRHQALLQKSSVKRKMPCRRSKSVTPVSSHHYFTRFARRKLGLDEFQYEDTVQDTNRQTPLDSSQLSIGEEGMSDILETEEPERAFGLWQSDLWAQMKHKIMKYLHYSRVFPESIPCKFDYVHKDWLMRLYNLHAAVYQSEKNSTHKTISDFKSASGLGYYEVTVMGLNHDVAIDVAFLPLFSPEDPHFFQLEDTQNDNLLSCMSCISESQRPTSSSGRPRDTFPLSDEIVKAAMDLDGKHVVCILDICHLGGDKVEVFLNKIYKTAEPGVYSGQ